MIKIEILKSTDSAKRSLRIERIFIIIIVSFVIPKYNNNNYYHKPYMHKRTTHLRTHAIPQSPHKLCLRLFYKYYSKKKLIIFVKEEN